MLWKCELCWRLLYKQEHSMDSSCSNLTFGVGEPEIIHPFKRVTSQGQQDLQHLNSRNCVHFCMLQDEAGPQQALQRP